jgi:hypothetical protein
LAGLGPALDTVATVAWRDGELPPGAVVVVDIDGVVADTSARQHLLDDPGGRRNWDAFFAAAGGDRPLSAVPALLEALDASVGVVLVSGRPDWLVDTTTEWLATHHVRWDLLVVRRPGDRMPAARFKRRVLRNLTDAGHSVLLAIDDDAAVVDAYRQAGVPTLHPGPDRPR